MGRRTNIAVLAAGLALTAGTALADRIDGNWCKPGEMAQFSIDGPHIQTVTGRAVTGDYGRHSFAYVVPEGDPGAGDTVRMRLLNDEEVRVWFDPGEGEVWERCKPVS